MPTPASPRKSQEKTSSAKKSSQGSGGGGGDIRAFFGNAAAKPKPKPPAAKGTGDEPITIDESDSDGEIEIKKKPPATTSKHFASSSSRPVAAESSTPTSTRTSPRKAAAPNPSSASKRKILSSDDESDDEIPMRPVKRAAPAPKAPAKVTPKSTPAKAKARLVDSGSEDEPPARKGKARAPPTDESESEEEEEVKPKPKPRAKATPPASKAASSSKATKPAAKSAAAKAEVKDEDDGEEKKPKFNYYQHAASRAAGPKAPGSKDIPMGQPGCLAGLTLVFTGELESLGRDEAIELAKRYFAKVTGAPSGKTSYVILGENAGPGKLKTIKEKKIPTLTEDQFLDMIRTRKPGKMDDKTKAAIEKEEKKVLDQAKELERREKEEEKLQKRKEAALEGTGQAVKKVAPPSAQLWATKYAPANIKEICGNKGQVEKLNTWLTDWQKNYKTGFKRPGKDGGGLYRAVLISGGPGIGKTTSAHLVAKAVGYNPLELNASDARSKKLIENFTNIDNTSLDGFFQGKGAASTTVANANVNSRTCLIMDEVDGMSSGDRGGVGALNALIKKTKIPMILICNDRSLPKMKPLWGTTFNLPFRKPTTNEIRSRILSILHKEKLKIPSNVVDELIGGVNSDIRQVLNMLSTYKLSKSDMTFDEGKELLKLNEKNTIMTPFTITDKITGPYAFSRTNRQTLNDKMELFFHDISFMPLFIQEHYIKTNPAALTNLDGPEKSMKNLELISKAADWISDGDLVDRMIHGSEQHWSLLPLHAVTSMVAPSSYIYGTGRSPAGGGWGGPSFPQWLGQNSKQTKLQRQLTDIQIRMRLRVSGGRDEIRQQYMPLLASKIVTPLMTKGADAIDDTIATMDEYYLGKDDWDAFVELGVDTMKEELILKKIPTATKSAFTRSYNKGDHPIAFHKGDMFAASKKKIANDGPAPDNDEVFEEDEAPPEEEDDNAGADEDVNDVGKDKLIKAVKPKAKGKAKK
ncbi:Replication factor C subunit 1 [Vanrija pseudolonga]|uniref:Replication factor C subunit 1 n=1 Tax=Vanrija pseudolonga TaxID=143232 RepID=A0AAF0YDD4_9TREE|nr:Replication factor C subunit 1 [Vanrija pseudolonga]